jgi:hypothetical protein
MVTIKCKQLPKYLCKDCGVDVIAIGDWYMAKSEIWKALGLGWSDNLCLACLERRLGRPLKPGWPGSDVGLASTYFTGQPPLSDRLKALWGKALLWEDGRKQQKRKKVSGRYERAPLNMKS